MASTFDLVGETDAQVWADKWLSIIKDHPNIPMDKGAMIGWFANAIESGRGRGRQEEQARDVVQKIREVIFQAAGAATMILLQDHPEYIFPSDRVAEAVDRVCVEFGIPKGSF